MATIRLCWSENVMDHESHSSGTTVEILVSQSADIKKKNLLFFTCLQHVNQKLLFGRDKEQMYSLNENHTHPPRERAAPQCATETLKKNCLQNTVQHAFLYFSQLSEGLPK